MKFRTPLAYRDHLAGVLVGLAYFSVAVVAESGLVAVASLGLVIVGSIQLLYRSVVIGDA